MKYCVNNDGKPVHPPSKVLCKECLEALGKKMMGLKELFKPAKESEK